MLMNVETGHGHGSDGGSTGESLTLKIVKGLVETGAHEVEKPAAMPVETIQHIGDEFMPGIAGKGHASSEHHAPSH